MYAIRSYYEEQDVYDLHEFRRLNSEFADTEPAFRPVYVPAEKARVHEKDQGRREDKGRPVRVPAVIDDDLV